MRAANETKNAIVSGTPAQLAASVAYYGTLAFFPLVAALVAIAGLTLERAQVATIVNELAAYMPSDMVNLVSTQLQNATAHSQANIFIMIFAFAISIFGVSGAVDSVVQAIATIHDTKKPRSFIRQKGISILLTVGMIVGMAIVLPLLFVGPSVMMARGVPTDVIAVFSVVRWIALVVIATIALGAVYHFALPAGRKWRWLSWGSVIATVLWIIVSAVFSFYLESFANFSSSYSLFAGVIALMIWLDLSALAVLIGAYVDAALDR